MRRSNSRLPARPNTYRARTYKVAELQNTLAAIGQAREVEPGTYVS